MIGLDYSGTLVDDRERVFTTVNDILKHLGLKKKTVKEHRQLFTMDYVEYYKRLGVNVKAEELEGLYRKFYRHDIPTHIIPGVKETLQSLKQSSAEKLILISGEQEDFLIKSLKTLELENFFYDVVGTQFNKIEMLRKHSPRVYVGDTTNDAEFARAAGVSFIGVCNEYSYHFRSHFKELDVYLADSLEHALNSTRPLFRTK